MWHLLLLAFIVNLSHAATKADYKDPSFKSFCANPPNFGTGEYDDKNQKCHVTYHVKLPNDEYAQNFCERQHPFTLDKVERQGSVTICHLAVYYQCGANEFLIRDRCYFAQRESKYDEASAACASGGAKGASIHKVANMFEQKWIAAFFTSYRMMWIGNTVNDLKTLKVAPFKGMIMSNAEGRLVSGTAEHLVIVTSKGAVAAARGGTINGMVKDTFLPVLCSRNAISNPEYHKAVVEKLQEVGIVSHFYKGHDGEYRPFTILRVLADFEMGSEFAAGSNRLHYTCKFIENGYAASPLDFYDVNDFKDLLKREKVNIVAVPGSRSREVHRSNNPTCTKRDRPESYRREFFFELKNGGMKSAMDNKFWRPTFPDGFCADTPRVALGFSQEGLVDVPNIARMFVACTFGKETVLDEDEQAKKCSQHATYNKKTDTCICNPPFDDLTTTKKLYRFDEDKKHLKGAFCVSCNRPHDHEIAIVVDNNKAASKNRHATLHILRCLAFIGHVTKSRMKLFTFDSTVHEGKYQTPSAPVEKLREHFVSDFPEAQKDGANLAAAMKAVYNFFKAKSSSRKLMVMLLSSLPDDLDGAMVQKLKLDQIGMSSAIFSYFEDDKFNQLSNSKAHHIKQDNYWDRAEVISRVQQAMLHNACVVE